ncbi:MAG TPA: aspartate kinase [Planctomycetota bacterium]|jgi:aspartate kinase|nr:aspartate kinase [Planctomycetota bacterium]
MKLVMKFGGSSVADAEKMRRCAKLVQERAGRDRVAVVVSALDGVTEELLELAEAAGAANRPAVEARMKDLRRRHEECARALEEAGGTAALLEELHRLVVGISAVGELTPRSKDAVVSFGERLAAVLFRRALEREGMRARTYTGQEAGLVTNDRFGEAEPLMELSLYQIAETLRGPFEAGEVPVVTGFIAATQHGVTTTIGRGGSDYTATIVGAALKADEIWIWSDVDGLMTADPRIVPEARRLDRIRFIEAVEMGLFGAKSMHPRALEPAAERRIPVRMKNTFRPEGPGTLITDEGPESSEVVRSVLLVRDAGLITVTGAAMMGRPGTAARIFQLLADRGVNVKMIILSVSEAGISFAVSGSQVAAARAAIEAGMLRSGEARRLDVEEGVAIVAAIGSNMKGHPGTAARVFGAVARRGINVIAIAQGSSELSISFIVKGDAGPEAVRALHQEFLSPPA